MRKQFDALVTISYNVEGARNNLGEPTYTLTERDSDVKCNLQPRSQLLSYEFPTAVLRQTRQGLSEYTTHVMYVAASQTVESGDIITDADGSTYLVATIVNWKNRHKEVLLSKITGK